MIETLLLLLLTGVLWAGVGVLFGRAPSGRAELSTFFFLNAAFFTAFVFLASPPAAAPFGEVLLAARRRLAPRAAVLPRHGGVTFSPAPSSRDRCRRWRRARRSSSRRA